MPIDPAHKDPPTTTHHKHNIQNEPLMPYSQRQCPLSLRQQPLWPQILVRLAADTLLPLVVPLSGAGNEWAQKQEIREEMVHRPKVGCLLVAQYNDQRRAGVCCGALIISHGLAKYIVSNIIYSTKMSNMLRLLLHKWRKLMMTPMFPTRGVIYQTHQKHIL